MHILLNACFVLKGHCLAFLKKKAKSVLVFIVSSSQLGAETDNIIVLLRVVMLLLDTRRSWKRVRYCELWLIGGCQPTENTQISGLSREPPWDLLAQGVPA